MKPEVKRSIAILAVVLIIGGLTGYKAYQNYLMRDMLGGIDSQMPSDDIDDDMTVTKGAAKYTVFDVGEGEAILIKSGSTEALIDTGTKGKAKSLCKSLEERVDGDLEYLVITAPGAGRTGGLEKVAGKFNIGTCILGDMQGQSSEVKAAVKDSGVIVEGDNLAYEIGDDATLFIIKPDVSSDDPRDRSLVTYFTFGSAGFVALSDAGREEISRAFGDVSACNVIVLSRFGAEESNLAIQQNGSAYCIASASKESGVPSIRLEDTVRGKYFVTGAAGTLEFVSDGSGVELLGEKEILRATQVKAAGQEGDAAVKDEASGL